MGSRRLLYERVVSHVRSRIASRTYVPEQRLPSVSQLAQEVGVGISTVREGLRVLEGLGLVQVQQGRGVFVVESARPGEGPSETLAPVEDRSLLYILEVRQILEPEMAALAAVRATLEQVEAILGAAEEHDGHLHQARFGSEGPPALAMGFHDLVQHAANNPVLTQALDPIAGLLAECRRRVGRIDHVHERSVHHHYLIGYAIEQREPELARRRMLEHITDLAATMKDFLGQP